MGPGSVRTPIEQDDPILQPQAQKLVTSVLQQLFITKLSGIFKHNAWFSKLFAASCWISNRDHRIVMFENDVHLDELFVAPTLSSNPGGYQRGWRPEKQAKRKLEEGAK